MIGMHLTLICDSNDAEDEFWNEIQDNKAELEDQIADAVRMFTSETVYRGAQLGLVPRWEAKISFNADST